jgi:[ribosomal protein S5]-alanine N-acetyltransferase
MRNRSPAEDEARLRVTVAPISPADLAGLAVLLAESATFHRAWVSYPTTPGALRDYAAEVAAAGGHLFVARRREDAAMVGLISLSRVSRGAWQSAECGCAVGVRYQGHGYLAEALVAVVTYAMTRLGLHRIEALVQPENTPSERMLTRAGFRPEGIARSSALVRGSWLDHVRWAITADDLAGPKGGEFRDGSHARSRAATDRRQCHLP